MGKEYKHYLKEIESLKLGAYQTFLLQIAAAFKVDDLNYDKLRDQFIKEKTK